MARAESEIADLRAQLRDRDEQIRKLRGALATEKERRKKARADHARLRDIAEAAIDDLSDGLQCPDWPATKGDTDATE